MRKSEFIKVRKAIISPYIENRDCRVKITMYKKCNEDVLKMYKEYILPTLFLHIYYIINTLFGERGAEYAE